MKQNHNLNGYRKSRGINKHGKRGNRYSVGHRKVYNAPR